MRNDMIKLCDDKTPNDKTIKFKYTFKSLIKDVEKSVIANHDKFNDILYQILYLSGKNIYQSHSYQFII